MIGGAYMVCHVGFKDEVGPIRIAEPYTSGMNLAILPIQNQYTKMEDITRL